ncbi:Beta-carotene ketolase [Cyclobacterium qasimii M12-11B]|uniref:Beta-carotene ketolase n=1 Tax=Cyclobacterium qasimii M12-11B TaxID=641524 RepID=S7X0P4_9BACT|nr:Beta-carotene ketolase [Cyclobacterium qasimii M12-11B]
MLFSFNFYWKLFPNHHKHHNHVATDGDPDFHSSGKFLPWYLSFILNYLNIWQFLLMAVTFNLLKLVFPVPNLVLFWMLPAILSTLQLFYFGTYLPHKGMHSNKHHSGTLKKNHLWAFLSCYFLVITLNIMNFHMHRGGGCGKPKIFLTNNQVICLIVKTHYELCLNPLL